jgi:3-oxoacyl-[acyl-carrier protein] reductase
MSKDLAGARALVTGASSGIGLATVAALEAAGASVVGLDRVPPPGPTASHVKADLTDEWAVVAAVAEARRRLGGIDILVNAAGIMQDAAIGAITAEHVDRHFDINVRGLILVTREALPAMKAGGRIINVASELAYIGRKHASVYVATKAAVLGLTRSWARELAPDILVNAVAPGPTDTPLLDFANLKPDVQALELSNPLGRLGQPREIADAIVFLAGPGASFITGQCLGVNGGAAMA